MNDQRREHLTELSARIQKVTDELIHDINEESDDYYALSARDQDSYSGFQLLYNSWDLKDIHNSLTTSIQKLNRIIKRT